MPHPVLPGSCAWLSVLVRGYRVELFTLSFLAFVDGKVYDPNLFGSGMVVRHLSFQLTTQQVEPVGGHGFPEHRFFDFVVIYVLYEVPLAAQLSRAAEFIVTDWHWQQLLSLQLEHLGFQRLRQRYLPSRPLLLIWLGLLPFQGVPTARPSRVHSARYVL